MFFNRSKDLRPYTTAVIVAAGNSERMGGIDKQMAEIGGIPVIIRSVMAFENNGNIDEIIVVCRENDIPLFMDMVKDFELLKVSKITKGGETRQESVMLGAKLANEECQYLAIHDGARPMVTQEVINACMEDAREYGAATAGVKCKDTIKLVNPEGFVEQTPDRGRLYITQTPQIFERELYFKALEKAKEEGKCFTDDCQLVENFGHSVYLSQGDYQNIKITTPDDLVIAQAIAEEEEIY